MPLELRPATEADAARALELEHDAYSTSAFTPILFPGPMPPPPPSSSAAPGGHAAELAEQLRTDPTIRMAKVVDTDLPLSDDKEQQQQQQYQAIAFAKWHVYTEGAGKPAQREFGPGCNAEACEALFGGLAEVRARTTEGKPCVQPKHQRRGAAGLLLQRVLEDAREHGLVVRLESTPEGHALYYKHGFRDVEKHEIDFGRWGLDKVHEIWAMVCENP